MCSYAVRLKVHSKLQTRDSPTLPATTVQPMPQSQAKQLEAINAAWVYFRANRTVIDLAKMGLKAGHRVRKLKPTDGPAGRLLMELKVAIEQRVNDLKRQDAQTPPEATSTNLYGGYKIGTTGATEPGGVGATEIGLPTETSGPHTTVVTELGKAGAIEPSGSADMKRGVSAASHWMRLREQKSGAKIAKQKEVQVQSKQLRNELSSTELSSTDVHVTSYIQHPSDKRRRQRSRTPRKDWSPPRERKPKYWCRCHQSGERCRWDKYGGCTHHMDLDRNRHKIMMEGYANANAYRWCSALSFQEKNAFLNSESIELPDFDEDP